MDEKANEVLGKLRLGTVRVVRITYEGKDTFEAVCESCGGGRPHVARGANRECVVCGTISGAGDTGRGEAG